MSKVFVMREKLILIFRTVGAQKFMLRTKPCFFGTFSFENPARVK